MTTTEKIFIGKRLDPAVGDSLRSRLESFRSVLHQEQNQIVKFSIEDIPDILETGSANVLPKFEAYLNEIASSFKNYFDRERYKMTIPDRLDIFRKSCDRISMVYQGLPEWRDRIITFYFDENFKRISCGWDWNQLSKIIDQESQVYAETEKEKQVMQYIDEIIEVGKKLKKLCGTPMLLSYILRDSINDNSITYNVDGIYKLFNILRK